MGGFAGSAVKGLIKGSASGMREGVEEYKKSLEKPAEETKQAEAKAENERAYRDAMAAHAKMPSSEVQMFEKYANDPKFRKAVDMMTAAKREPITRETLFKEYIKSPVASIKSFSEYVSEYEKEFGPLGVNAPTGVIVSRAGQP